MQCWISNICILFCWGRRNICLHSLVRGCFKSLSDFIVSLSLTASRSDCYHSTLWFCCFEVTECFLSLATVYLIQLAELWQKHCLRVAAGEKRDAAVALLKIFNVIVWIVRLCKRWLNCSPGLTKGVLQLHRPQSATLYMHSVAALKTEDAAACVDVRRRHVWHQHGADSLLPVKAIRQMPSHSSDLILGR